MIYDFSSFYMLQIFNSFNGGRQVGGDISLGDGIAVLIRQL